MSMEYEDFINHVGKKFTVVNGAVVAAENGEFIATHDLGPNTVYLNKQNKSARLVPSSTSWIGHTYHFRTQDCSVLAARYVDNQFGTNYREAAKVTKAQYFNYCKNGIISWFEDQNLTRVGLADRQENDFIIYDFDGQHKMHVGVVLGDDRILHHLPRSYSSVDTIDYSETEKFLGVYRHA